MNGHKQAVHMKNRQRVDQHIASAFWPPGLRPTPIILERERIAEHVAVREHRAFAATSCATGVEDGGQVIGLAHHGFVLVAVARSTVEQTARAVFVEGEDMLCARLERDLADPTKMSTAADHHRRLGVANEILNLGTLVSSVQWQKHIPGAQSSQVQDHGLNRFFDLHGHPTALWQVERLQQVGHHGRGAVEVLPAVAQAFIGFDCHRCQVCRKSGPQGRKEIVIAHDIRSKH